MNALAHAASAELLKLRSVRSTWWFVGGALATVVLVATLNANSTASELRAQGAAPGSVEAASTVLAAVSWVEFILGSLGMLAMTSEYATRSIVVTLACTPSRTCLLMAKALTVGASVLVIAVLIAVLGTAASAPQLGGYVHVDAAQIAVQILRFGVHLSLIALLALGLGALIRRSAGALAVLFGLLLVAPPLLRGLAERLEVDFLNTVADYLPGPAGERFMTGEPFFGLVLAAWAAAALAASVFVLRVRDA